MGGQAVMLIVWWLGACVLSAVLGYWLAEISVRYLRKKAKLKHEKETLVFWLGATERAIATTLVIFAPPYLPVFIGGWVALKFAVGWQRYAGEAEAGGAMVALIGNVISFAVSIAIGLMVNPSALETWAKTSH
jgi:hypothetical protein